MGKVLMAFSLTFTGAMAVQECDNPDAAYTVNGDGTLTDVRTGLTWDNIDLYPDVGHWDSALKVATTSNQNNYKGHSGWRLPNIRELASLVAYDGCPSLINSVFGASGLVYWSSSPDVNSGDYVWVMVTYWSGAIQSWPRLGNGISVAVRLVRDGQGSGPSVSLSVSKTGQGTGTVSSNPDGVSCGSTCTANFASGAPVTLGAMPTPGTNSRFVKWGGACSGTQLTCTLIMDGTKSVTAEFASSLPGVPTIQRAIPGSGFLRVFFAPPLSDGGSTITSYTATCTGGGTSKSATGAASPLTVTGLTNGLTYSCTVRATNGVGSGTESSALSKVVKRSSAIVPILGVILGH
jgi:hypothetical protein